MRDILFRGKNTKRSEFVEGSLLVFPNTGRTKILRWNQADLDFDQIEVIPETVGQYTGLTDKNGKKIFEGDIVDASNEWWDARDPAGHDSPKIEVKWDDAFCGFDPFANYDCDCGVYINASGCEVIGNIYDNPELLEGKND